MIEGQLTLKKGNFTLQSGAFSFAAQGISVLFGRSGSGKSTLLRAFAGLDGDTRGQLRFNGETWQNQTWRLPTTRRNIGFVFQDAALFPHLTVRGNLDYACQRAPAAPAGALQKMAERVGISHLLDQAVTTLSGGERQRVAIARALLSQPRLLCMDEPLSALDWQAKAELLALIDALAQETGLPVLYITHAPREVERLASRVIFMADGHIERIETLREALARPDSPLFDEEGPVSVLQGTLHATDEHGLTTFGNEALQLRLSLAPGANPSASRLRVLARNVSLATEQPQGLSILNQLPIAIAALHPVAPGRVTVVCLLPDGQQLLAEITAYSCQTLALKPGMQAFALIKSVALME
ncbi:molybdenum ABC transporter ATP-binding protein [Rhodoferax sp.]|uniref:molybdenum ABC transporter ATP-binding protein n=1 Tax=Rhodoferax sp. TaxID=50421 RepID=UPI00273280D3|nr:molybdenum ABC transporter ATP-binding protein [Rhodoferax sp.]MDP3192220.1 molybdenum ABC transporter ATP-binding protein [Rhodoferax sp.]MDP3335579.1 molybdenum ABC transporter ATP-binding protein [Rhodoferax sp.]